MSVIKQPVSLSSQQFAENKLAYYRWLREEAPVHCGRISIMKVYFVSRYEDCVQVLKDPRLVRNRTTATGGRRTPIPLPKWLALLATSMIQADGDEHRRLRNLVHQAFTPSRIRALSGRIESLSHQLLDQVDGKGTVNLMEQYARPLPVAIIAELMGLSVDEVPHFVKYMETLTTGFTGWRLISAILWKLPQALTYVRGLIDRKRADPGDDILTGLIEAEEQGDRLTDDELIAMVFLLVVAGHETTVHLISNSVATLTANPSQLSQLLSTPDLWDSAVEELLRFYGPIHATKPNYACEDIELHGVTIPKKSPVMPLLGAANFDPAVFENPESFDIQRSPNKHLSFGHGVHFCLGAALARMETQIALRVLWERYPSIKLAVPADQLRLVAMPGWHRYQGLPVKLEG